MEITVKMTPEEYDLFRVYQHEELCSLIVNALDTKSQRGKTDAILKDNAAALEARRIAGEWYV